MMATFRQIVNESVSEYSVSTEDRCSSITSDEYHSLENSLRYIEEPGNENENNDGGATDNVENNNDSYVSEDTGIFFENLGRRYQNLLQVRNNPLPDEENNVGNDNDNREQVYDRETDFEIQSHELVYEIIQMRDMLQECLQKIKDCHYCNDNKLPQNSGNFGQEINFQNITTSSPTFRNQNIETTINDVIKIRNILFDIQQKIKYCDYCNNNKPILQNPSTSNKSGSKEQEISFHNVTFSRPSYDNENENIIPLTMHERVEELQSNSEPNIPKERETSFQNVTLTRPSYDNENIDPLLPMPERVDELQGNSGPNVSKSTNSPRNRSNQHSSMSLMSQLSTHNKQQIQKKLLHMNNIICEIKSSVREQSNRSIASSSSQPPENNQISNSNQMTNDNNRPQGENPLLGSDLTNYVSETLQMVNMRRSYRSAENIKKEK